jgi:carboxyl-terminal processing protease
MSLKTRAILVLVIGLSLGLGLTLGERLLVNRQAALPKDLSWEQARLFAEVMERVKRDYIEQMDDSELVESAIRGMVAELDRHSQYLDEDDYEDIRISASGSYSGVGIEISTSDNAIVVVAPFDGTPAQRAGIRSGDRIVAIDNVVVAETNLDDVVDSMRGRSGSQVILTISRDPLEDDLVFVLNREQIQVASVKYEILQPDFGYARISQFTDSTAVELRAAIDVMIDEQHELSDGPLAGLILDLRNNPGGILDAAVDVSDLFLEEGVIVTADGRTPESRFTREASGNDILNGATIVVLVNEGSASASEIVAGALQDHGRATIMGTTTFGKGLVQTVMPLSRGRAIKLTTSRYYTPSGDSIHEIGIAPDVVVEGSDDVPDYSMSSGPDRDADQQLIEAIELLGNQRVMHSLAD